MAGRSDIDAGGAKATITLEDTGVKKGIRGIQKELENFKKGTLVAGKQMSKDAAKIVAKTSMLATSMSNTYSRIGKGIEGVGKGVQYLGYRLAYSEKNVGKWARGIGFHVGRAGGRIRFFAQGMIEQSARIRKSIWNVSRVIATIPKRIGTWIKSMGDNFVRLGERISTAGKKMAVAAIIMSMPFIVGAKTYAAFSKEMAFVSTMLDDVTKHIGGYTEGVRKLSVEFGEATKTLSRGLYDILSAGFAPVRALEMLRATTIAAKAGMAETAQATKAIIAVLNAYGLGAEHAAMVSDTLFTTVRYGVLTFAELAGHIGLVASSAAQAHVAMDEMGAILAVITRGGIETSAAVIALNNILKAFLSPTGGGAEVAKQLKAMGLGIDMSIQGLRRTGLVNIFKEIGKLPTEVITQLFPTIRSQRGALALKSGLQALSEVYGKFANKLGATNRAMKEVEKSFGFLLDRVKQAGVLILSYIGEAVAGSLSNVGEKIINLAVGFGLWIKVNKGLVIGALKLIVVLGKLAITMMVVGKVMAMVGAISMAFTAGISGIIALAVGIGVMGAAMYSTHLMFRKLNEEAKQMEKWGTSAVAKMGEKRIAAIEQVIAAHRKFIRELKGPPKQRATTLHGLGLPLSGAVIDVTSAVSREIRIRRELIKGLNQEVIKEKQSLDAAKKRLGIRNDELGVQQQQLATMIAMRGYRTGRFAGYWHTPVLAHATKSVESQQLDVLKGIKQNTGDQGPLYRAILGYEQGKALTT